MSRLPATKSLHGELRMWSDKKRKSVALAKAYASIPGCKRIAERARDCAPQITRLGYHGENPHGLDFRTLFAGTCKSRLCPVCATLRARRQYARVVPRFEQALQDNKGVRAAFATFTVPNVPLDRVKVAGSDMLRGFRRLTQRKPFKKAVAGWMRATELTLNAETNMVHPHLHVVLLLRPGYFARSRDLYITQAEWLDLWRDVMRDPAIAVVDIRPLRPREPGRPLSSALGEVTKYPLKPMEVFELTADGYEVDPTILKALHEGLRGKRMFAFGGILRGAADIVSETDADDDWTVDNDDIRTLIKDAYEPEPYFVEQFDWTGETYADPRPAAT